MSGLVLCLMTAVTAGMVGCGRVEIQTDVLVDTTPDSGDGAPYGMDAAVDADTGESSSAMPEASSDDAAADAHDERCPDTPVVVGASCFTEGQVCTWKASDGAACNGITNVGAVMRCAEGEWQRIAACLRVPRCPEEMPDEGSSCSGVGIGYDCFYSADGCAPGSLSQCDGSYRWRHINACVPRSLSACAGLMLSDTGGGVGASDDTLPALLPRTASWGTELLTAFLLDSEVPPERRIHLLRSQTATTVPNGWDPEPSSALGFNVVSGPVVASRAHDAAVAWVALPGSVTGPESLRALLLRRVSVEPVPDSPALIREGVSETTGMALRKSGGWLAFRRPSDLDESKSAAAVVALAQDLSAVAGSEHVVTDESLQGGMVTPIPRASALVERWRDGYVIAAPVPATGDVVDDSGVEVSFLSTSAQSFTPSSVVRAQVGTPKWLDMAVLRDGSVALAYRVDNPPESPWGQLAKVVVVQASGAVEVLPWTSPPGQVDFGPHVASFEDGFVVAWTGEPEGLPIHGNLYHLTVFGPTNAVHSVLERNVISMRKSDTFELEVLDSDRTIHLVGSASGGPGSLPPTIIGLRFLCNHD